MFENHSLSERVRSLLLLCAVLGIVVAVVLAVAPAVFETVDQAGVASDG